MSIVEQLDLFAFLAELDQPTEMEALDAVVLGWMIQPATLALIIRSLDDTEHRAALMEWGATTINARLGTREAHWESRGLRVDAWPGHAPWVMTWARVLAAVRSQSTPETRQRFLDAYGAERAHELARENVDQAGPLERRRAVLRDWLDHGYRLHLSTQALFATILPTDDWPRP